MQALCTSDQHGEEEDQDVEEEGDYEYDGDEEYDMLITTYVRGGGGLLHVSRLSIITKNFFCNISLPISCDCIYIYLK